MDPVHSTWIDQQWRRSPIAPCSLRHWLCFVLGCLERATLCFVSLTLTLHLVRRMVELTESLQKLAIDGSGAGLNGTGAEELEELRAEINRLSDNIYGERVTTPLGVS